MTSTIGLIGAGRMGLAIVTRLVQSGFAVIASDRRAECEGEVRRVGAAWQDSALGVAAASGVLITVLPGARELEEVMAVALPALQQGATWIDMTSAAPDVGRKLLEMARGYGIECLDAPLGGNPAAAATGRLQLYAGGSEATVAQQRRLLELLGRIEHVGGHGAGYTTKLLINLLWFGQAVAVTEALLLARRMGLDLDRLRSTLTRSSAASRFIEHDLDAPMNGDYLAGFGLDRCCEELDAVTGLARAHAVPFELSNAVRRAYAESLARYGAVGGELLAVALLEERAGLRLRSPEA
ncbi:MAG: NAD(P)-dependent oxidoreductase [Solirubrobacterales bacterium]|nr:NAD(P)-dependent oxidoreductase [Solirubrobacterales bacterium]